MTYGLNTTASNSVLEDRCCGWSGCAEPSTVAPLSPRAGLQPPHTCRCTRTCPTTERHVWSLLYNSQNGREQARADTNETGCEPVTAVVWWASSYTINFYVHFNSPVGQLFFFLMLVTVYLDSKSQWTDFRGNQENVNTAWVFGGLRAELFLCGQSRSKGHSVRNTSYLRAFALKYSKIKRKEGGRWLNETGKTL